MPYFRRRRTAYRRRRPYGRTAYRKRGRYTSRARGYIAGRGAYKINNNSLLMGNDPPVFNGLKRRDYVEVIHREYLGDVITGALSGGAGSPTVFNSQVFTIQPGLAASFPWLSQIANSWQEYELCGAVYEFKSLSSDAIVSGANSALGSVSIATQYDVVTAINSPFISKQQMLETEYSSDSKPSLSFFHAIECARNLSAANSTHLYTRQGAIPVNSDPRWYDLATVTIATQGMQAANVNIGEIWISYHFKFFKNQLQPLPQFESIADKYHLIAPLTALIPLGTTQTLVIPQSNALTTIVGNTIVFDAEAALIGDTYMCTMRVIGSTNQVTVAPVVTTSAGLSLVQCWSTSAGPDLSNHLESVGNVAQNLFTMNLGFMVTVLGAAPYVATLGTAGTYPTGTPTGDLIICKCPEFSS